jgi:hypothetical protein
MACVTKRHRGASHGAHGAHGAEAQDRDWRACTYTVASAAPMETPGPSRPGKRRAEHPPVDDRAPLRLTSKRGRDDP